MGGLICCFNHSSLLSCIYFRQKLKGPSGTFKGQCQASSSNTNLATISMDWNHLIDGNFGEKYDLETLSALKLKGIQKPSQTGDDDAMKERTPGSSQSSMAQPSSSFESINQSTGRVSSGSSSTFSSLSNDDERESPPFSDNKDSTRQSRNFPLKAESQVTNASTCYHEPEEDFESTQLDRGGGEESCVEFWHDDKYIEDNFDMNFNFNDNQQSPHLYLIGTAINSSSMSNLGYVQEEEDGDQDQETTSGGHRRPCLSGLSDIMMKNESSFPPFGFNHINQINVDGFEWDLI